LKTPRKKKRRRERRPLEFSTGCGRDLQTLKRFPFFLFVWRSRNVKVGVCREGRPVECLGSWGLKIKYIYN
jgi:hypothetical protein